MVGAWYLLPDDGDSGDGNTAGRTVSTEEPAETKTVLPEEPEPTLPPMECPAELTNCEVASGSVIYVEAVDPDGDGDAHFVTLSNQSITSTAITVFDVKPELRPNPLPGRGDLVGGYGPVYEGSFGQRQIEVIEFHVGK
jgi:hypothetical protein